MRPKIRQQRGAEWLADRVREAAAIVQEIETANTLAAGKLTAAAYLREAMSIAGTTPQRLDALEAKLTQPQTHSTFEVAATLRRMVAAIRSPNWSRPPRELRRLNFLMTPEALAELIAIGSSTFECFALGVRITAQNYPESFGECEDSTEFDKRLVDLALRRDDLFALIEKEQRGDDLMFSPPDSHGNSRVSFKMTNGAVTLGQNAAERLCNWWLTQKGLRN